MRLELQAIGLIELVVQLVKVALRRRTGGILRVSAGLGVGVLLILKRPEEPELVPHDRPAKLHGRILEFVAVVRAAAVLFVCRVAAGDALVHEVEIGVALERVAALTRDDVEHRARDVAITGRRAEREDLDFFDRVGVRPRPRRAGQRRREIGAVDQVEILVGRRPERLRARAGGRRRANPGRRVDQIEEREAPHRRIRDPLAGVVGGDLRARRVHHRRLRGDSDCFRLRAHLEFDVELGGRAQRHRNPGLMTRGEALELDGDVVGAGRKIGEPVHARLVRHDGWRAGDHPPFQRDGDPGQYATGLVGDDAANVAGRSLGPPARR